MTTSNSPTLAAGQNFFTDPTKRILIMSVPRTGSTLLTDLLNQAGIGRNTQEFLHRTFQEKHAITSRSALTYIRKTALRHSTASGTFLCKVSYNSFVEVFEHAERDAENWLRYFTHFILIKRRDHLAQAISEYFAIKSGIWNVQKDEQTVTASGLLFNQSDLELVTRILSRQISEEDSWTETIKSLGLNAIALDYEELVSTPKNEILRLIQFIGITPPDDYEPEIRFIRISELTAVKKFKIDYLNHLQGL